jgi:hypothetical protein
LLTIVDAIAVADVEAGLGAIPPDRVLDEPGKGRGKFGVEFPGVNLVGNQAKNPGAAGWAITPGAVRVVGQEPGQDSGPDQEVVDQRVDRDHPGSNGDPVRPVVGRADQDRRQRHGQDLVRDPYTWRSGPVTASPARTPQSG